MSLKPWLTFCGHRSTITNGNQASRWTSDAIETIAGRFATVPSHTVVLVDHNGGGAIGRVGEEETAYTHRGLTYNFLISSGWANPADSNTNINRTRELSQAMQPFS